MIARTTFVGLAVAALHLVAVPAGAQVTDEPAVGRHCSFVSDTHTDTRSAEVNGGPLVATAPGATISMTCTFQVGPDGDVHAGPDTLAVTSPALPQTTMLHPQFVWFEGSYWEGGIYFCEHVTIDGEVWYRDSLRGAWSTDSGVPCTEVFCACLEGAPFTSPVFDVVDDVLGGELDREVCPVLASLARTVPFVNVTPEGDVWLFTFGIWDCPPEAGR